MKKESAKGITILLVLVVGVLLLSTSVVSALSFKDIFGFIGKLFGIGQKSEGLDAGLASGPRGSPAYICEEGEKRCELMPSRTTNFRYAIKECKNNVLVTLEYCDINQECRDGGCVNQTTCTDSDGGLNYYVKGETKGVWYQNNVSLLYYDSCSACDSNMQNCKMVYEYYCGNDSLVYGQEYLCPYGCVDGKCVVNPTCGDGRCRGGAQINLSSSSPVSKVSLTDGTYTIELISASDTSATIKVTDPSGYYSNSREIDEGNSRIISGVEVIVLNADETNLKLSASIIVGETEVSCPEDCVYENCTDSDGGVDIYNKGNIRYFYDVPGDKFYGWHETEDTCSGDGESLYEFSCDYYNPKELHPSKTFRCENGCVNGGCVEAEIVYDWKKHIPATSSPASCLDFCDAQPLCSVDPMDFYPHPSPYISEDPIYCRKTTSLFGDEGDGFVFDSCFGGTVAPADFDNFYCCCPEDYGGGNCSTNDDCPNGTICTLGVCMKECAPLTCEELEVIVGREVCGWQSDGCGNSIYCGECISNATCGDGRCRGGAQINLSSSSPVSKVSLTDGTYTIELVSASDTSATIKVTDPSGYYSNTREIDEGLSRVVGGVPIIVLNADETNLKLSASIIVGETEVSCPEDCGVVVNRCIVNDGVCGPGEEAGLCQDCQVNCTKHTDCPSTHYCAGGGCYILREGIFNDTFNCTDNDGLDIFSKGNLYYYTSLGLAGPHYDGCFDGVGVEEKYCLNGKYAWKDFRCDSMQCLNGACLPLPSEKNWFARVLSFLNPFD